MKRYVMILCMIMVLLLLAMSSFGCKNGCKKSPTYPYKVSLEQANEIMGSPLPVPTYLPEGFDIVGIYVLEHSDTSEHMVFLISEEVINEGDISPNFNEVPMKMYVTLYRKGQVGGLKLVGERYDIGGTKGVLVTGGTTDNLWWILSYPQPPGQYELKLSAIKEIPIEELVKVARSVPQ